MDIKSLGSYRNDSMRKDNKYWLDILVANGGFDSPTEWIVYAKNHNFNRVDSVKLLSCPDCGCEDLSPFFQYIYYSNLITINLCSSCGLYFSDTIIDRSYMEAHFDAAYKDETYFKFRRKKIFSHIAYFVERHAKKGSHVLDVGGGKGHLLNMIKHRRPDLFLTLNDISSISCEYAKEQFGLEVVCGAIPTLSSLKEKFKIILFIDVIYYESAISKVWEVADMITDSESGSIFIRIPNKLGLIKFKNFLNRNFFRKTPEKPIAEVKHFNTEHIFLFSKKYLYNRLKSAGFNKVVFKPSPPLLHNKYVSPFYSLLWIVAWLIYLLSFRKFIMTPSCEVIASRSH